MTADPHDPARDDAHAPTPDGAPAHASADAFGDAPPAGDAALLVHARALEGLRRTQAELAAELAQGRELRTGLARLDDALHELADGQARVEAELVATRRRLAGSQRLLAALLVLLTLGGAGWWWQLTAARDATGGAASSVARDVDGGGPTASGAATSAPGASAHELARTIDVGARVVPSAGFAGALQADDAAAHDTAALADAEARVAELERSAARERDEHAAALARLTKERNQFVGEAAKLRADLVRAEQRFASLTEHGYQAAPAPPPPARPGVSRTSERDGPAELLALNAALETLGVDALRVIEIGASVDGALHDVLVSRFDAASERQVVDAWHELRLVEHDDALRLVLRGRDGDPELSWHVDVDASHPEVFARTTLEVPARIARVARVRRALEVVLLGQQLELLALDDVVDGELRGLRLRALGSAAEAPGELRAERGELLRDGPTLLLREGDVTREGVTRPFWRGEWRRPLPGADLTVWTSALESLP